MLKRKGYTKKCILAAVAAIAVLLGGCGMIDRYLTVDGDGMERDNATVLDENGKSVVLQMGCYGIGVSRTIAAAVEQHYDDKGLVWPKAMAPYHASLVVVNVNNEEQMAAGEELYKRLQDAGFDILMDDRKERAGVKFNDADLIGLPVRITVGKKIGDGIVEYKLRTSDDVLELTMDEVVEKLTAFYND